MSKVSVAGSRAVMSDVIEAAHDLNLLHVSDYDGSWEGFDNGDPIEGAESASEKLVTVRSLQTILGVDDEDAGPTRIVTDDAIDDQLEDVRQEVNALDDRRSEVEDELRSVEERIDAAEPFVDLGIDLDLLRGYETLSVAVGEGSESEVRDALADADGVREFETFSGDRTVAAFARPTANPGDEALEDALVGAEFTRVEVPDASGNPGEYVETLRHERQKLESKLESVEAELSDARLEHAGFLLAAEEKLAIDVQKREIPLQFATTEHAFVAEGWIPTENVGGFEAAMRDAAGDHVDVEELERATYDEDAHGHATDHEAVADGGTVDSERPPVVQDNPGALQPFELLVKTINRPRYTEIDPTVVLFLTFPAFFGFMIGDLGYGLLYAAIGYGLWSRTDSAAIRSLGGIAMWAGGFTMLFGVLYGEVFGLHVLGEILWGTAEHGGLLADLGGPPIHKGLQPAEIEYAQAWLVVALVLGLAHVTVGHVFGFVNDLDHGVTDAFLENGSWFLMLVGIWWFVFSAFAEGMKPPFLFEVFGGHPFAVPLVNLPLPTFTLFTIPGVGPIPASIGVFVLGTVLLYLAEPLEVVELLQPLVNVLSYTRLAAVLLAKAGMAFVVNLLFFGAYNHHGEFHFLIDHGPEYVDTVEGASLMFPGLVHGSVAFALVGLLVLVLGHLLVLGLGVTSAGLQAVRLEYVEFFNKFYEGGGAKYDPFGYQRTYTTED